MDKNNSIDFYKEILGDQSFIIVDIGARGGVDSDWDKVRSIIHTVLFEPDEDQRDTLEDKNLGETTLIQKAVWGYSGKLPFHVTRNRSYCSVLEPNEKELEGNYYYDRNFYKIDKVLEVEASTLGEVLLEKKIKNVDFLKIDIQGGENKVFEAFDKNIWDNLQGVKSEAYSSRLYEDGANISDTLKILYDNHMELFDMKTIAKSPLTSSCGRKLFSKDQLAARPNSGYKGRSMVFDLLLLKNRQALLQICDENILRKGVFSSCVLGYYDRALDLIFRAAGYGVIKNATVSSLQKCVIKIHKNSLSLERFIKEKIKLPSYKLNKR